MVTEHCKLWPPSNWQQRLTGDTCWPSSSSQVNRCCVSVRSSLLYFRGVDICLVAATSAWPMRGPPPADSSTDAPSTATRAWYDQDTCILLHLSLHTDYIDSILAHFLLYRISQEPQDGIFPRSSKIPYYISSMETGLNMRNSTSYRTKSFMLFLYFSGVQNTVK